MIDTTHHNMFCNLFKILLLSLFLLGGCNETKKAGHGAPPRREIIFPVQTSKVSKGPVTKSIALVGAVKWSKRLKIKSEVSARILESSLLEGSHFEKNSVLIRLDPFEYKIELARLKAELTRAEEILKKLIVGTRAEILERLKALIQQREAKIVETNKELARVKKLIRNKIVTEEELTSAESEHNQALALLSQAKFSYDEAKNGATAEEISIAKAEIEIHKKAMELTLFNISRCETRSTFKGVVLQKLAEETAFVEKGETLLEIASLEDVEIIMEVPERFSPLIPRGKNFQFTADAFPGESFNATVITIIPLADDRSRNLQLRAKIEEKAKEKLVHGMFLRAEIPIFHKEEAILVPLDAITFKNNQKFIYVVENEKIRQLIVETGLSNKEKVEVLGNVLKAGESVVTTGGEVLFTGAKVKDYSQNKNSGSKTNQ